MTRLVLEQVTDFGDYTGGKELNELLKQTSQSSGECRTRPLSDVRVSPDGRHIHVILRRPRVGLMTFDKYDRPQFIRSHNRLDLGLTRTVPIVDLVYLNHDNGINNRDQQSNAAATLAVVFENGKVEFWRFQECRAGWNFLQTADLCNSPRAKVVSVSACSDHIIWCEERPPSESSAANTTTAATTTTNRNNFRYCICKRAFEVEEGAVTLGGVKIALHNNPRFTVVSSGEHVYLLPDQNDKLLRSISKFFLVWFPQHDTFRVSSTCKGTLFKRDYPSVKESDFKRLVADCLGYLSSLEPPEIYCCSPAARGGLLLLLSTGWVSLLQWDGTLRQVYKLADNCTVSCGMHNSLRAYHDTLALTVGRTLYLIDLKCGRELEKISLKREGLLYVDRTDTQVPRLLSETGLFAVMQRESDPRLRASSLCDAEGLLRPKAFLQEAESLLHPGALLLEAVFEEACKYYQQRSLSSTQLTVDKLKKGGMFQAPISLASIVRDYLNGEGGLKGAGLSQQGGRGAGEKRPDKLLGSLEAELKALVSLEKVKETLVKGSEEEVEAVRDSLVEQEVTRLLSSGELDREALLHLNTIFSIFPRQAWSAAKAALQLRCNGEDTLSSWAPQDVWKTILSPVPAPSASASLPYANGQPKQKLGHRACPVPKSNPKLPSSNFPAANTALPVFELLCHSIFNFQPGWLPRFLEIAQLQQGSAGLGLSLASSSWGYPGGRGAGEGGEGSLPLYKRALAVLPGPGPDRHHHQVQVQELEVELLLVSGRPNAILQALRILMGRQQWERVTQVAQRFCQQSPLLNKEIFTTLLCEVAQHRDLDPYLELLWTLCPEDVTVTAILNLVLKNIPSHNSSSATSSPLLSSASPAPFGDPHHGHLTVGLLKPLLSRVLQRETKPSQRYADILQSPSFPPPPPHQTAVQDNCIATDPPAQECSDKTVQGGRVTFPINPV